MKNFLGEFISNATRWINKLRYVLLPSESLQMVALENIYRSKFFNSRNKRSSNSTDNRIISVRFLQMNGLLMESNARIDQHSFKNFLLQRNEFDANEMYMLMLVLIFFSLLVMYLLWVYEHDYTIYSK